MLKRNSSLLRLLSCSTILLVSTVMLYGQSGIPASYGPLPSTAQLKWHDTEMYAMVCFGLNTFTDKEWGYGDIDPALFKPSAFDASQIVTTLGEAGFKGVLLVAKHHDGFCLWPTKTTAYSVASSPWMDGKGDMVKAFQLAAEKEGLKFGIYNSPWDRNSPTYGTSAYLKIYQEQLTELHSNYGPLFISWYDGANGGDGYYGGAKETRAIDRATYYKWDETWRIVNKLQPGAVIFSDIGPDVRWVGNEKGFAAETSWATFTPKGEKNGEQPVPGASRYAEAPVGNRDGRFWIPAECDVPLRDGWYYHASQDHTVKTAYELFDLYFKSVGRGAALDLGVAPDRRGILHEHDVASLKGFGQLLKKTFAVNLAAKAKVIASNTRGGNALMFGGGNMVDNNKDTYWATDDRITTPHFTIQLDGAKRFNVFRLKEYIALGQRVEDFAIDVWVQSDWKEVANGTSIGSQRLIRLPNFVTTDRIRVRILKSPVCPLLSEFSVFAEPELQSSELPKKENRDVVSDNHSLIVVSAPGNKNKNSLLVDRKPTVWRGSFNKTKHAENSIIIDLGKQKQISRLTFVPPLDTKGKGLIDRYQVDVSDDGKKWTTVASGEFGNILTNPVEQHVSLGEEIKTRFIRFIPMRLVDQGNEMLINEIRLD